MSTKALTSSSRVVPRSAALLAPIEADEAAGVAAYEKLKRDLRKQDGHQLLLSRVNWVAAPKELVPGAMHENNARDSITKIAQRRKTARQMAGRRGMAGLLRAMRKTD